VTQLRQAARALDQAGTIHLWAFDLLAFNGRDLRPQPLAKRQARLHAPSVVVHSAFDTVRASWYGGLE